MRTGENKENGENDENGENRCERVRTGENEENGREHAAGLDDTKRESWVFPSSSDNHPALGGQGNMLLTIFLPGNPIPSGFPAPGEIFTMYNKKQRRYCS